ncbi:hypothetical protein FHN55_17735 [Streptomyces sp. NP160]|uniref:alginate lyase family protein n=1 Tax=Streptomyces sp. NP160 TaxID=2586637 RepID=UPI00111A5FA3|nr:alginate lyase family protein [Streptomyces sp. NP160]TNM61053.1 hypothetical protein FHN55_17735 [Streptomyces sp. NP160]
MEHAPRPGRRQHRARATTRTQLLVALVAVALGGVLVGPVAARAGSGSPEQHVAARAAAALADRPTATGFVDGSASSSAGTVLSPDAGALVVDPLLPRGSYGVELAGGPALDVRVGHATLLDEAGQAGGLYERTEARRAPDGDHYALVLVVRAHGHVAARLVRDSGGRRTVLASSGYLGASSPGRGLRSELAVVGTSPVELSARVWTDGEEAPDWQLMASDDDDARITAAGASALSGYLAASAAQQSVTVSDAAWWSTGADAAAPSEVPAASSPAPSGTPADAPQPASPEPSATAPGAGGGEDPAATVPATPSEVPSEVPSTTPQEPPAPTPSAPGVPVTTSPAGFQHPGIMTSASQLAFVRQQVARGAEPWTSALARTRASRFASLDWVPRPVAWVGCGSYNQPNEGCTDETDDAQAAYTHALLWSLTGDRRHADKAAEILDAWSSTLQGHRFDTALYKNGRLQAAWAGEVFPKAAELLRHSDSGWDPVSADRFGGMLRAAFLPMVRDGWTGGGSNWQMSMADATIAIGVYLDDRAVFEDGVGDWRRQLPATIYLSSDGPLPVVPPGTVITERGLPGYWKHPTRYVDGLQQETCRDADHMTMGVAAALNGAETASIQGVDLYGEGRERLVAAMEHNTRFLNDPAASGWVCPQPLKTIGTASRLGWEVGYHHYAVAEGVPMPETRRWIETVRPKNRSELFMNWSTLTHGS